MLTKECAEIEQESDKDVNFNFKKRKKIIETKTLAYLNKEIKNHYPEKARLRLGLNRNIPSKYATQNLFKKKKI